VQPLIAILLFELHISLGSGKGRNMSRANVPSFLFAVIPVLILLTFLAWDGGTTGASTRHVNTAIDTTIDRNNLGPTHEASKTDQISERDLLHQAFRQIDVEARRLDRLFDNAETLGQVVVGFVIAVSVLLSVFGYRSLSDLKKELQISVQGHVENSLRRQAETRETFEELADSLKEAQNRWETIAKTIQDIETFSSLTEAQYGDPMGAYVTVKTISEKGQPSKEDRRITLALLSKLVTLGEKGRVDPNLLYNASSVASNLDFDFEAVKLATLCAHWDPKPTHLARRRRLEDVFGIRFSLADGRLHRDEVSAEAVREEAWHDLPPPSVSTPRVRMRPRLVV